MPPIEVAPVLPESTPQPAISSNAHSPQDLDNIFQELSLNILGIDPNVVAAAWAAARIKWQMEGQPAWDIDEDIVFIGIQQADHDINRTRDLAYQSTSDPAVVLRVITYTRVWAVTWTLYGPNSTDRARQIISGINEPVNENFLYRFNLAMVPDFPAPVRAPEIFNGQWWERSEFTVQYNELVTETVQINTVRSVEIIVENRDGIVADITVTNPNA